MNRIILACVTSLLLTSYSSQAEIGITASAGQTFSHTLTTSKQQQHELSDDGHYGFSVDWHDTNSKYGLFYSKYEGELEASTQHKIKMEYLLFQSAVYRPIYQDLDAYLGLQLGVNRLDTNFADADSFFASGLFAGIDYEITQNFSLGTEVRWITTIVKNKSKVTCDSDPATTDMCSWHFDGDTLNQIQVSANITYRF